jgi:hypothetical protein
MILLAMSASLRKAFHVAPLRTTAPIPSSDWFRLWRCDGMRHKRRDIVVFTNHVTLFSFVIDATRAKTFGALCALFTERYNDLFVPISASCQITIEEIQPHTAIDRSLIAVMNSLLLDMSFSKSSDCAILEERMNYTPIGSRGFQMPIELYQKQLNEEYS